MRQTEWFIEQDEIDDLATVVTPVLKYWSYPSLVLSHHNNSEGMSKIFLQEERESWSQENLDDILLQMVCFGIRYTSIMASSA